MLLIIMPKRCILGCPYDAIVSVHRFPNPVKYPDQFKAWVQRTGGSCFTEQDKNRNKRINHLSLPSLYLSNKADEVPIIEQVTFAPESRLIDCIPTTSAMTDKADEVQFSEQVTFAPESRIIDCMPTTSAITDKADEVQFSEQVTFSPESRIIDCIPTTSAMTDKADEVKFSKQVTFAPEPRIFDCVRSISAVAEKVSSEHNYCKLQNKTVEKKKRDHQLSVPSLLLNKLRTSRRKIQILQSSLLRARKKNKTFASRLSAANKISAVVLMEKLVGQMTTPANFFVKMQYMQTSKKPRGRRFSLEEKVLSLSWYKKSPRCYPLLAKYFTLPSVKSLKRLLTHIQLQPGLNKSIFLKMKETVSALPPEERLCSLIFDEMSISPQIHYNAANDRLSGFTSDCKSIADHVLVFMVKGLKGKFKQPIAYYFTNRLN